MPTYEQAIMIVRDFTGGLNGDNPEYERGQLELLADLFGYRGAVDMDDRKAQLRAEIEG